jgi:hypothetical protein
MKDDYHFLSHKILICHPNLDVLCDSDVAISIDSIKPQYKEIFSCNILFLIFSKNSLDVLNGNKLAFDYFILVVPSKRAYTKKSGSVTSNIDKRYNPLNQEEQDSSSSSDDLKTMTEVCQKPFSHIETSHHPEKQEIKQ